MPWATEFGEMFAALVRTVFAQTTPRQVRTQLDAAGRVLETQFLAAAGLLREAAPDITAFTEFPILHWKKVVDGYSRQEVQVTG